MTRRHGSGIESETYELMKFQNFTHEALLTFLNPFQQIHFWPIYQFDLADSLTFNQIWSG